MSGGNTTQFIFTPDVKPDNRKYLLMLTSAFWTVCIGCTLLSVLVDVFSGGLLGVIASPFIIAAVLIPNIGLAFVIPRLQRYQRSHRFVLIGAFLGGAVIAIPPALVINTALFLPIELSMSDLLNLIGYGTIAGIVEEGIKGLILLFIYLRYRDEFHDPVDGVVLGALIGLGFAMTEDISYFFRGLGDGGVVGLMLTFFLRLGLGWMNHSVFTSITGLALGYARMAARQSPLDHPAGWLRRRRRVAQHLQFPGDASGATPAGQSDRPARDDRAALWLDLDRDGDHRLPRRPGLAPRGGPRARGTAR